MPEQRPSFRGEAARRSLRHAVIQCTRPWYEATDRLSPSALHCEISAAQGWPAMHPQSRCKPRWRPVTHLKPVYRAFFGFFAPANIGTHLARVEVFKAGLAGD